MYEMLTGLPPFYAQDIQTMYNKIMTAKLEFPDYISPDACSLLSQLLERDPIKRIPDAKSIKQQSWFKHIDWEKLSRKEMTPPFIPPVKDSEDTSWIDEAFTSEPVRLSPTDSSSINAALQGEFDGFAFVAASEQGH